MSCCGGACPTVSYLRKVLAWPWARKVQSTDIKHDNGTWNVADIELEQGKNKIKPPGDAHMVILTAFHNPISRSIRWFTTHKGCVDFICNTGTLCLHVPRERADASMQSAAVADDASSFFVTLNVKSVDNPTDVFDDLSYKIRKNKQGSLAS